MYSLSKLRRDSQLIIPVAIAAVASSALAMLSKDPDALLRSQSAVELGLAKMSASFLISIMQRVFTKNITIRSRLIITCIAMIITSDIAYSLARQEIVYFVTTDVFYICGTVLAASIE